MLVELCSHAARGLKFHADPGHGAQTESTQANTRPFTVYDAGRSRTTLVSILFLLFDSFVELTPFEMRQRLSPCQYMVLLANVTIQPDVSLAESESLQSKL